MKTKRIVILILTLVFVLSIAGCGNAAKETAAAQTDMAEAEEAAPAEETAEPESTPEPWMPEHDITMRCPFAAGGAFDTIMRIVGQGLQEKYDTTVLVTNLTGANGTVAAADLFTKKGDPSEMMGGGIAMFTLAPLFNAELSLSLDDFKIINGLIGEDVLLVVYPDESGINNWEELAEYGKENRLVVSGDAPGGTVNLLSTALFGETGIEFETITSGGANLNLLAVQSGDAICTIAPVAAVTPFIDSGMVPILCFSDEPYEGFDGMSVPTAKSLDLSIDIVWRTANFLMTTSDVDQEIVNQISDAVMEYMETEDFKTQAEAGNFALDPSRGEEVQQTIANTADFCKQVYDKYYKQ